MIPKTSPTRVMMFGLAGAGAALVQISFLGAFSYPFDLVDLSLVLIVGLVTSYRFPAAFAAAAGSGLVRDALSADSFGIRTALSLALAALLVALFRRVFTDISFFSVSIMSAIGYVMGRLMHFFLVRITALLSGQAAPVERYGLAAVLGGMVIETACCVLAIHFFNRRRTVRYEAF